MRRQRNLPLKFSLWAAALALLLAAPPLPAQSPDDTEAALFQEVFTHLRDDALAAPQGGVLLRNALTAAQQALAVAGTSEFPAVPILTGRDEEDLRAVAVYVQAAVKSVPGRSEVVLASILRAMVRTIADPQGAVFTPPELAAYVASLRGEHGTIGLQVDAIGNAIVVIEVMDGGPASRAGVQVDDQVLEVDAFPVSGRTPDYVLGLLRGRPGSAVLLTIRRPLGGPVQQVNVVRQLVRELPVRARLLEPRLGYLRLLEFTERAHADVERALTRLTALGAQALVFDLRSNGGGLVDEAISIASNFLPSGLVAQEEGRTGLVDFRVRDVRARFSGPVVVLVNGGTASASEIVAGALQDERMTLVGARTFGKGTVQTVYFLRAGWGLRVTTARYRTRAGRSIEGVGLNPDVPVLTPPDQVQGPGDSQFEMARFLARRRLETTQPAPPRP